MLGDHWLSRVRANVTAEDIKFEIGSAAPLREETATEIRGRDLTTGLPKGVVLSSEQIREALAEPVQTIIDAIKNTLERTPPELAADVSERGILLAVIIFPTQATSMANMRISGRLAVPIMVLARLGGGSCNRQLSQR